MTDPPSRWAHCHQVKIVGKLISKIFYFKVKIFYKSYKWINNDMNINENVKIRVNFGAVFSLEGVVFLIQSIKQKLLSSTLQKFASVRPFRNGI